MTDLENIIAQGESYFTEFKRNINSDLKKEMVAFANASGGNVFIGIEDDVHRTG
jgi:ATP-dependent DNA helicase RecG